MEICTVQAFQNKIACIAAHYCWLDVETVLILPIIKLENAGHADGHIGKQVMG